MRHSFLTRGVCSTKIEFDLDNGKIGNVAFTNGCNGNLKAISALVDGTDAKQAISLLRGIECGTKGTSCADQLARAMEQALEGK